MNVSFEQSEVNVMENILISVIIPVYKTEKFLRGTVESVINQTYKNVEIILVDDGSPDNCPQLCDSLSEKYDCVKTVHKENGGLSSARNAGIEAATGKYIYFLDSDDAIAETTLADMVEIAERENSDAVLPNTYCKVYEDSDKKELAYHFTEEMFETDPLKYAINLMIGEGRGHRSTAVLFKTSTIVENNLTFPLGLIAEDYFFMTDFMVVAKKLSVYTKPSLLNLKRSGSITSAYHPGFKDIIWLMDEKAHNFIKQIGRNDNDALQKADDFHCRNLIAYAFIIMSSKNKMPYKEREDITLNLLNHEKARKVWRKKHPIPYFKSKKTQLIFAVIYNLLRFNFIKVALKIMSYS